MNEEDRRYALQLDEGELQRYRMIAEQARAAERSPAFRAARGDDNRAGLRQELEAAPVRPTFFAPFFTAVGRRPA